MTKSPTPTPVSSVKSAVAAPTPKKTAPPVKQVKTANPVNRGFFSFQDARKPAMIALSMLLTALVIVFLATFEPLHAFINARLPKRAAKKRK
jgi:hypothetical protein